MFKRKCIEFVQLNKMNELLAYCKQFRNIIEGEPVGALGYSAFLQNSLSFVRLTVKTDKVATYVFRKDDAPQIQTITGMDAYTELAKAFKRATGYTVPEYDREIGSARALLIHRSEYDGKRVDAICYDQNSAYGWAMLQDMPDTREMTGEHRIVEVGEIGFNLCEPVLPNGWEGCRELALTMVGPGKFAEYIFKAMPSPFSRFVHLWYGRKKNAKTPEDKAKAKGMLVYSVGYLQRINPFLRCAIVEYANQYITSLIDENTIYCNTDSLVSLVPREDLAKGDDLGQFKIEHSGRFAHIGFNYQWNEDVPSVRHIPKSWFPKNYDILRDPMPTNRNPYELNMLTLQIERNDIYEN